MAESQTMYRIQDSIQTYLSNTQPSLTTWRSDDIQGIQCMTHEMHPWLGKTTTPRAGLFCIAHVDLLPSLQDIHTSPHLPCTWLCHIVYSGLWETHESYIEEPYPLCKGRPLCVTILPEYVLLWRLNIQPGSYLVMRSFLYWFKPNHNICIW